jgi:retinol-binding protein 3
MRVRALLVFTLFACLAAAQPQSTTVPDTPAGHTFQAWLAAFNSGDREKLDAYYKKYDPGKSADDMMGFRGATGGFELLQVLKSEPLSLKVLIKEHNSETRAVGDMTVKEGNPAMVVSLGLRAIPPGVSVSDLAFNIDAAARARVIDGAISNLNEFYVDPEIAKKMADDLRARQKRGEYNSITDGQALAAELTDDLQGISHDKHLRVNFSPAPIPDMPQGPGHNPATDAEFRKQMERMNCGFDKVEVLSGNVGYVKFNVFADPELCGPTASAAMNFLANVDAIIFDLRDNGGGDPKMVAFMCSYLFSEPTHLNDLWERKGDVTTQYWTLPYVPGKRFGDKPAFVLTSKRTFSGAEEFTYNLKNLKRATIVGETTGGGAHPVAGHRIDEHFMIGVPFAKAVNPISKTNWEGTGVEPDVKVPASDALTTAEKLAAEKIAAAKPAADKPAPQ